MNKNINLTKILEGLEGIELYSPIFGECKLESVDTDCIFPILVKAKNYTEREIFTKEGLYDSGGHGECLLFPSKDQRDWSKFVRPIKRGTPVMCQTEEGSWTLKYFFKKRNNEYYVFDYKDGAGYHLWEGAIIQYKDFDPNDIEGSIRNYNIQK